MQLQYNVNSAERENIKLKKENERVYSLLEKKEKQITDLTDKVNIYKDYKEEVGLLKNENKEMTKDNNLLNDALNCFKRFIRQNDLKKEFQSFLEKNYRGSISGGIEQTSNEEQSSSLNLQQDSFWDKSENKRAGRLNNRHNNNPNYNELIRKNRNFLELQGGHLQQQPVRIFYKKNNNLLKARAINNTERSPSIRNVDRIISFAQDH